MTAISGTVTANTVVTAVAASSGNGDTIAAIFNGIIFRSVSNTACVATNASGTVTIYWPASGLLMADQQILQFVANEIAAVTSLTSPITLNVSQAKWLTS